MSEKRYLLTLDEIMDIQAMVFLGAVLRCKSLAESSPSDEWLEAHAHHERTCHMFVSPECEQQWADSTAYYCSACGHGNLDPIVGGYCRYCGARVVTA